MSSQQQQRSGARQQQQPNVQQHTPVNGFNDKEAFEHLHKNYNQALQSGTTYKQAGGWSSGTKTVVNPTARMNNLLSDLYKSTVKTEKKEGNKKRKN